MIARLEEVDALITDPVDQTVLLPDAPRPATGEHVSQWLRLARTLEWVAKRCLNKLQDPESCTSIRFHPIAQIVPELVVEYRVALSVLAQSQSPAATDRSMRSSPFQILRGAVPSIDAWRCEATAANGPFP